MANPMNQDLTALVVDDDRPLLELLQEILREEGFSTTGFERGKLALEALARRRFDLLVVDVGLPDMNGMQIGMEARERYGDDIIVLIITGDPRQERVIAALELGADDFMGKPFDVEELLARIAAKRRRALSLNGRQPSS